MRIHVIAVALTAGAIACGEDEFMLDGEVDVDQTESAAEVININDTKIVVRSTPIRFVEFDTNYGGSVSQFFGIQCTSSGYEDRLLTGIRTNRESGSADNYVARIRGRCREYEGTYGTDNYDDVPNGLNELRTVYAGPRFRTPDSASGIAIRNQIVPVGIDVRHRNKYVRDVRIVEAESRGVGTSGFRPKRWTTGLSGTYDEIRCRPGDVLTGMHVKATTNNGKIREIRIVCRPLSERTRGFGS